MGSGSGQTKVNSPDDKGGKKGKKSSKVAVKKKAGKKAKPK